MGMIEDKLSEFAKMFGSNIGYEDIFICWEDVDRNVELMLNDGKTNILYYHLTLKVYHPTDIHFLFIINKKTNSMKFVAEHFDDDPFTIYKHDNIFEMTQDDRYDMVMQFSKVAPIFTSLIEMHKLDCMKEPYYKEIDRVAHNILGWV